MFIGFGFGLAEKKPLPLRVGFFFREFAKPLLLEAQIVVRRGDNLERKVRIWALIGQTLCQYGRAKKALTFVGVLQMAHRPSISSVSPNTSASLSS
jgi:hypothetical protein